MDEQTAKTALVLNRVPFLPFESQKQGHYIIWFYSEKTLITYVVNKPISNLNKSPELFNLYRAYSLSPKFPNAAIIQCFKGRHYFCLSKLNSTKSPREDWLTTNWGFVVKRDNIEGISLQLNIRPSLGLPLHVESNFGKESLKIPDCFSLLAVNIVHWSVTLDVVCSHYVQIGLVLGLIFALKFKQLLLIKNKKTIG